MKRILLLAAFLYGYANAQTASIYSDGVDGTGIQLAGSAVPKSNCSNPITIELWFKWNAAYAQGETKGYLLATRPTNDAYGMNMQGNGATQPTRGVQVTLQDVSKYNWTASTWASYGVWHHCMFVWDASGYMNFIVDGQQAGGTGGASVGSGTILVHQWRIGMYTPDGEWRAWLGNYAQYRFWGTARSQNEAKSWKNRDIPGSAQNLIWNYKMNDAAGCPKNYANIIQATSTVAGIVRSPVSPPIQRLLDY